MARPEFHPQHVRIRPFQMILSLGYAILADARPLFGCESCGTPSLWLKPVAWITNGRRPSLANVTSRGPTLLRWRSRLDNCNRPQDFRRKRVSSEIGADQPLRNTAAGWHLFLTARGHHRQIIGADIDPNGHEHCDEAEPEAPIMMRAPPVRSLVIMTVTTFAIRMQVFGVVHGLLLSTERIDSRAQMLLHNPSHWAAALASLQMPSTKRRPGK